MVGRERVSNPDGFSDIIDYMGGTVEFARAMGVSVNSAGMMRVRNSIPVHRWPELIAVAKERGMDLSLEQLVELYIRRFQARGGQP